ncbi:hypothetical protein TYRP_014722 [Tyrophagus putrescentiae]|nr:hypothetical protein TYRP_014722 [Tyrophagus putrescentiae]
MINVKNGHHWRADSWREVRWSSRSGLLERLKMSQILSLIVLFAGVFLVVDALSHSLLTTPSPKLRNLDHHRDNTKQYRVQYDFKHHYINATRPEGVKDNSLDLICHENNLIDHYSNIVSSNPIYSSISNRRVNKYSQ